MSEHQRELMEYAKIQKGRPEVSLASFALEAGFYLAGKRTSATTHHKPDGTVVSDVEEHINHMFIQSVRWWTNDQATVKGEEESFIVPDSEEIWTVDPGDGSGEYVRDTKEDGSPLPDDERTTCFGAAVIRCNELQLSVINNPFRGELLFTQSGFAPRMNGEYVTPLAHTKIGSAEFNSELPYDYVHWDGAPVDTRVLESTMIQAPLGSYSAIYQTFMVATGKSAFSVFPGDTIHDIAPGAFAVEAAGGVVSDVYGEPLDWNDLRGAVFAASPRIHEAVIRQLASHI